MSSDCDGQGVIRRRLGRDEILSRDRALRVTVRRRRKNLWKTRTRRRRRKEEERRRRNRSSRKVSKTNNNPNVAWSGSLRFIFTVGQLLYHFLYFFPPPSYLFSVLIPSCVILPLSIPWYGVLRYKILPL